MVLNTFLMHYFGNNIVYHLIDKYFNKAIILINNILTFLCWNFGWWALISTMHSVQTKQWACSEHCSVGKDFWSETPVCCSNTLVWMFVSKANSTDCLGQNLFSFMGVIITILKNSIDVQILFWFYVAVRILTQINSQALTMYKNLHRPQTENLFIFGKNKQVSVITHIYSMKLFLFWVSYAWGFNCWRFNFEVVWSHVHLYITWLTQSMVDCSKYFPIFPIPKFYYISLFVPDLR